MTNDPNFWKNKYKQTWSQSEERENMIVLRILNETGKKSEFVGLGAGLDTYLSGTAESQGHTKGQSDIHILETNIYIEVTGPLVNTVKEDAPLWVRPDKVKSANTKFPTCETWIVHHLSFNNLIRVVSLDNKFFNRFINNDFLIIHPRIRGEVETYIEILANDECVQPWHVLINRLKNP